RVLSAVRSEWRCSSGRVLATGFRLSLKDTALPAIEYRALREFTQLRVDSGVGRGQRLAIRRRHDCAPADRGSVRTTNDGLERVGIRSRRGDDQLREVWQRALRAVGDEPLWPFGDLLTLRVTPLGAHDV